MITIKEYIDAKGRNPYAKWFNRLNAPAAARVVTALVRMEQGNLSNAKSVGEGVLENRVDFGPGYRIYFGRDGDQIVILLGGGTKKRQQKEAAKRHRGCQDTLEGIQKKKATGELIMALTKDFKETIKDRIERDPAFREELLKEGIECLLTGDVDTGKAILRDFINATMGFESLGSATDKSPKSLMRMFSPKGNPQARNIFEIIAHLQKQEGIHFEVQTKR